MINPSHENPAAKSISVNDLPAHSLPLSANEVHLWQAKLNEHAADKLRPLLSEDEIVRADRFKFAKDREHYTVARALLRKLLAAYLGVGPDELRFNYSETGKPSLAASQSGAMNFNLAHSHDLAVYAFSEGREIGVDVEFIRDSVEGEEIAERFFSAREMEELKTVPMELRNRAFFDCWTRKEAYIKARGKGLSMELDQFDVSLIPGEAASLLRNHKEPDEVGRWTMQSVSVPDGYVAALVVEGRDLQLESFELTA